MEDHELLEMAAKACGMPRPVDDNGVWSAWVGSIDSGHWWNPLDDDGDAFRLAQNLVISINICRSYTTIYGDFIDSDFLVDECPRRAIVRAAAEIGKSMP